MSVEEPGRIVFAAALRSRGELYSITLCDIQIERLLAYYSQVKKWNNLLHLVANCTPEVFASRHILESLYLLAKVPRGKTVVDVGSGGGLPLLPCLLMRDDLRGVLIESNGRKAAFLRESLSELGLSSRARVINSRFESITMPPAHVVTSRALDRFIEMLPVLVKWSEQVNTMLLFGGKSLERAIVASRLEYFADRLPESEQRFLFTIENR